MDCMLNRPIGGQFVGKQYPLYRLLDYDITIAFK